VLQMIVEASLESPKTRERMDAATLGVLDNMLKSADITASAERVRILIELTPDVLKLSELQKPQKPK
jgi:putative heme degradation protein